MRFRLLLAGLLLSWLPLTLHAEGRSIIVLDASGSMWGQIDGRAKLEIAREALATVLAGVDPTAELGLMAYGHRQKGACDDIELVVSPGPGTAQAISDAAASMKFLGKTPLTEAVRRAAAELKSTEAKATVILITDGIETCEADPCALGAELEASGVDFTAHVVGFGLTEEEGKTVACLAENTGGKYIQASDAASLSDALKTTVVVAEPAPAPAPEPEPALPEFNFAPRLFYAAGGEEVPADLGAAWDVHRIAADGSLGERITTEYGLPEIFIQPGTYRILTSLNEAQVETDITLTADAVARPEVVLNAGRLFIHPKGSADGPIEDGAAVVFIDASGERLATHYGDTSRIVPAGDMTVEVTVGNAVATETVTVKAGELTEKDIIAAAGLAVIDAFYVEGMLMDDDGHAVTVEQAKKKLDGSRERIGTTYGKGASFTLPPGDYVALVEMGLAVAESPFTVKAGERSDVVVVLNAGVLAVTAPGANVINVYSGKTDISGNRNRLRTEYTDNLNITAAAGDYVVEAERGDARSELPISVKAGERAEITLP